VKTDRREIGKPERSSVRTTGRAICCLPDERDVQTEFPDREVAVKVPRFRIAGLMVLVAIMALNFGAIRALLTTQSPLSSKAPGVLGLGALPMANLLAVGMLVGRPRSRPCTSSRGFAASGAAALGLYITGAWLFSERLLMSYLYLGLGPISRTIGQSWPVAPISILYVIAVVMLSLPQVTLALIGGVILSKFKIAE
jgi:hypothetical protein